MSPRRLLFAAMLVGSAVLAHDGMVRLHAALFLLAEPGQPALVGRGFTPIAPP